jgi:myo-inositol 2-dehydrogenase / D-chiro-inositol 1-dehydrogenase
MADELRYGVIGTGMMGIEHIHNIEALPGARVTAIADPHPRSRATALEALGGSGAVAHFEHHRDLLGAGTCDVVVIASPNHTHAEVLLDILGRHPVHVLVEKPLCTTVADCREVLRAAPAHEGAVAVGLEYRYMPSTARFLHEVRSGTAGTLRMLAIREHRFPFLDKVGAWNRFSRNTGGTLVEKCCHHFDLMRAVTGSDPVRVMASGGQDVNHLEESYEGEVPDILDNAFVIVEFARVRALLDLCMFAEATHDSEQLVAVGDRGKVEAVLPHDLVRIGRRGQHWMGAVEVEEVGDERIGYRGFHHGASYLEHLDLLEAVRDGRPPTVGLEDGLWATAMGVAAHLSIDEARPVTMDEVMGSD